jgi:chromosome segregation ATPase
MLDWGQERRLAAHVATWWARIIVAQERVDALTSEMQMLIAHLTMLDARIARLEARMTQLAQAQRTTREQKPAAAPKNADSRG